jgi:hypothetical protein
MQPAAFGGLRLQMQASARNDHDSLRRIDTPGMMHTSTLSIRVATLNLEQDHKRWDARRELVIDQLAALQPDVVAFNAICLPLQTGRWLQRMSRERLGRPFALLQQSTVNGSSLVEGEALLTGTDRTALANRSVDRPTPHRCLWDVGRGPV